MVAEISVIMDVRRAKKNEVYPFKLRVYYGGMPMLDPSVLDLTKDKFEMLSAKRVREELQQVKVKLNAIVKEAQVAAEYLPLSVRQVL